jgi:hypothetical protein
MKIQDARIGMTVTYKGHTTGKIVQIGNASRETAQKCNQPYEIIYMQPDGCIAPGGLLGDVPENFKEVGSNLEPVSKICPHLKGSCIKERCLAAEKRYPGYYCSLANLGDTSQRVYCALGIFIE